MILLMIYYVFKASCNAVEFGLLLWVSQYLISWQTSKCLIV